MRDRLTRNTMLAGAFFCLTTAMGPSAFAQGFVQDEDESITTKPKAKTKSAPQFVPEPSPQKPKVSKPKPKKQVSVPRLSRQGPTTWSLRGSVGTIANDDFLHYRTFGLAVERRFGSRWGVRGTFTYASDSETGLSKVLKSEGVDLKRADVQEFIRHYSLVEGLFRFKTRSSRVTPYVGFGLAMVSTKEIPAENPDGEDQLKFGHSFMAGLEWNVFQQLGIALEFSQVFFAKFQGCGGGFGGDDGCEEGSSDSLVGYLSDAYDFIFGLGRSGLSRPVNLSLNITYGF